MASRGVGRTNNASSVGMMEGAFFVGRTELLEWVNSLLAVNVQKVEQCASGAIYCQIVDSCYPGTIKMSKVNWMARTDHEFIPNYKLLQAAFDRNSIEKHIDVNKLIRAKYQDNLEFLQWMKAMWDREPGSSSDYDPLSAREGKQMPPWAKASPGGAAPPRPATAEKENVTLNRERAAVVKPAAPAAVKPAATSAEKVVEVRKRPTTPATAAAVTTAPRAQERAAQEREDMRTKLADQAAEIEELRSALEGLERERDYYFGKLRNVEILCTTLQAKPDDMPAASKIVEDVQAVLYAEDDASDAEEEAEPREARDVQTLDASNMQPAVGTPLHA